MDDWLEGYAAALEEQLGADGASLRLSEEVSSVVLELAAVVAHGTERVNAPQATYLAGRYVAIRVARGADARDALVEAVRMARDLLPEGGGVRPDRSGPPAG